MPLPHAAFKVTGNGSAGGKFDYHHESSRLGRPRREIYHGEFCPVERWVAPVAIEFCPQIASSSQHLESQTQV